MEKYINEAVKSVKKSTGCKPMEESELNLYIHGACEEVIKKHNLKPDDYWKFFYKVQETYLYED